MMCSYCMGPTCAICRELGVKMKGKGALFCKDCMVSCEKCGGEEDGNYDGDFFHQMCLPEHYKVCSAMSRKGRALASVNQIIENKREELDRAKKRLKSIQDQISGLENEINCAEEEKAKIEKEDEVETDVIKLPANADK